MGMNLHCILLPASLKMLEAGPHKHKENLNPKFTQTHSTEFCFFVCEGGVMMGLASSVLHSKTCGRSGWFGPELRFIKILSVFLLMDLKLLFWPCDKCRR